MIYILSLLLTTIILTLFLSTYLLTLKTPHSIKGMLPFECGFSMFKSFRKEFSLKFYIISLIFLIFDAEIILLLPVSISMQFMNLLWVNVYFLLISVMMMSLFIEWMNGAIDW
uniref:NADH dehydrogenase subunit 3 n=1 Tax=Sacculina confragosa TaxID=238040 RepID=UPI002551CEAD|nr:NADH dehydrogenase subunit 3 [Sacculina confragosa]WGU20864.1 NADH dehydrogenase subunit 3 [Sacculina confragosa]